MSGSDLWKYCTMEHCKELLLSFGLLGDTSWTEAKQLACLYAVANHVEKHYRPVTILKRDGSPRSLLVPDPLLKRIQSNLLHGVLDGMDVSQYATAYRKGSSIVSNAAAHVGKPQVLKLDIEHFFDNIHFLMVYRSVFSASLFPVPVGTLLTHFCCYRDRLPQGAPTSAAISNLVMRSFDAYIGTWCAQQGIAYTRYCDDMTFSGEFDARMVTNKVRGYLREMGFALNEEKTKRLAQHNRQMVTGIVVNQAAQAPAQYRKRLRQTLYYCEKFGVAEHLSFIGDARYLPFEEGIKRYLDSLLGQVNFVLHVNPHDAYFQQAKHTVQTLRRREGIA